MQGTLKKADSTSIARGLYTAFNPRSLVMVALIQASYFFVILGCIPARLMMRKKMGERAFSFLNLFLSLIFFSVVGFFIYMLIINFKAGRESSLLLNVSYFTSGHFVLSLLLHSLAILLNPIFIFFGHITYQAVVHFRRIIKRIKNNVVGYSYDRGESIYFKNCTKSRFLGFDLNTLTIRLLLEPVSLLKWSFLLVISSLGLLIFNNYTTTFLQTDELLIYFATSFFTVALLTGFSAICLGIEELTIQSQTRNQVLDLIDGNIELQKTIVTKSKVVVDYPFPKGTNENSEHQISVISN